MRKRSIVSLLRLSLASWLMVFAPAAWADGRSTLGTHCERALRAVDVRSPGVHRGDHALRSRVNGIAAAQVALEPSPNADARRSVLQGNHHLVTLPPLPADMPCGNQHSCCLRPGSSPSAEVPPGLGKHRNPMRMFAPATDLEIQAASFRSPGDCHAKVRLSSALSTVLRI